MKNFFKTSLLILLTAVFFQSCNTNESDEELVSDELTITTELADKITATATSLNDYNFYNKNANLDCTYTFYGSFINPEGNFYDTDWIIVGSTYLPQNTTIEEEKTRAFEETGIQFTYEDFFIRTIIDNTSNYGIDREDYLDFFADCNYDNEKNPSEEIGLPLSNVNFNCNNTSVVYMVGSLYLFDYPLGEYARVKTSLNDGLLAVENQLIIFNDYHNTTYTLDDVHISGLTYTSPTGREGYLFTRKRMLSYFENCSLARDVNDNDCLNFVYPLEINRINSASEEIISVNNDDDLVAIFNTTGELTFLFPINLLGQDGTNLTIETNEELENALDASATYCD